MKKLLIFIFGFVLGIAAFSYYWNSQIETHNVGICTSYQIEVETISILKEEDDCKAKGGTIQIEKQPSPFGNSYSVSCIKVEEIKLK